MSRGRRCISARGSGALVLALLLARAGTSTAAAAVERGIPPWPGL